MGMDSEALLFWISIATFWVGLASVVLMRLETGDRNRTQWHCLFYFALVSLGFLTVLAVIASNGAWMTSGAGLSVITVGATLDLTGAPSGQSTH